MSNDQVRTTTEDKPDEIPLRDASLKVDPRSLGEDEADFARMMGFGDDGNAGASAPRPVVAARVVPKDEVPPATASEPAAPESTAAEAGSETDEAGKNAGEPESAADVDGPDESLSASASEGQSEPADEDAGGADPSNFEEIHPRPAAEGIQAALLGRAEEVMRLDSAAPSVPPVVPAVEVPEPMSVPTPAVAESAERADTGVEPTELDENPLQAELDRRDLEIERLKGVIAADLDGRAEIEKEREGLRAELEALAIEREELVDQVAASNGRCADATAHAEKLEVSLRAARGALTPLPEGERALRAEVLGLRARLEEAREEHTRLSERADQAATELAIARARAEDRQHELELEVRSRVELERELDVQSNALAEASESRRELVELSARLQAENNELRSAQVALQETLEARDLEIHAREEHLVVTRAGLASRDRQLVDLNQHLEAARQRTQAVEADLARARIEAADLAERVARRESRIATLTETLVEIEAVMGRRIASVPPGPASPLQAKRVPPPEQPASADASEPAAPECDAPAEAATPTPDPIGAPPSAPALEAPQADSLETESPEVESEAPAPRAAAVAPSTAPPVVYGRTPDTPALMAHWRDLEIAQRLAPEGPKSLACFFAEQLHARLGDAFKGRLDLWSLGGSQPDVEANLLDELASLGAWDVHMRVLDSDPERAKQRRAASVEADLESSIEISTEEFDRWIEHPAPHAILLCDALFGQPDPAGLLDRLAPKVEAGALLLFADRYSGGALDLSDSTRTRLEEVWSVLPEALCGEAEMATAPEAGDDGGTPEGPRPGLAELFTRFTPVEEMRFGHLVDLIIGPRRGFGLDVDSEAVAALLESLRAIDESRGLSEDLAPRFGVGVWAAVTPQD